VPALLAALQAVAIENAAQQPFRREANCAAKAGTFMKISHPVFSLSFYRPAHFSGLPQDGGVRPAAIPRLRHCRAATALD
jgi:hypothetical protein